MGVCNCSMFCCMLLYVHSSIAIILMGKRDLVALLNLSSWCLVMVERLFLAVPWGCLRFVIVVFPDHTHLLSFYILWLEVDKLVEEVPLYNCYQYTEIYEWCTGCCELQFSRQQKIFYFRQLFEMWDAVL